MCGILGVVRTRVGLRCSKERFTTLLMGLQHRGPDSIGYVHTSKFSFGHTRLSIIDTTDAARQPMCDYDSMVYITYNGEIYNYQELKEELLHKGHKFQKKSDTEVILEAYKEWGISCVERFNGMFAFALYDTKKNECFIVRDRLGIKPVYYANLMNEIVFCSELKGIINYPSFEKKLNYQTISSFLSYRYSLGEDTYFEGVHTLLAGHMVIIRDGHLSIRKYWDIDLERTRKRLWKSDKAEIRALIQDAVQKRMISDVPLGAYLSGGIDSTIILSHMAEHSERPITTFTVGFKEKGYDETGYADMAASAFGANNIKITVDALNYLDYVQELIRLKDQPLGMHNEVALYLMAREVKKHVSVVLSGEGADELFGGYGRIFRAPFDYRRLQFSALLPPFMGKKYRSRISDYESSALTSELSYFLSRYTYFPMKEKQEIYNEDMRLQVGNDEHIVQLFQKKFSEAEHRSFYDKIFYVFEKVHLPGLLLMMDATSMASGVEVRVPFVDHRLVEEMFAVPVHEKLRWKSSLALFNALFLPSAEFSERQDTTKYLLRKLYTGQLPETIINRKKMVFPVPLSEWFSKQMNPFIENELLTYTSRIGEVFDLKSLKQWVKRKEEEKSDLFGRQMWLIMNLELWMRAYF